METKVLKLPGLEPQTVPRVSSDWTESEWFRVWLQLARGEYPGNSLDAEHDLSTTGQVAAAWFFEFCQASTLVTLIEVGELALPRGMGNGNGEGRGQLM